MDCGTSTRVTSQTKAVSRQSLPRKNSRLILMPWEKRHQHTLTSFIRKDHPVCENLTENKGLHRDNLVTVESFSKTENGEVFAEDLWEEHLEGYQRSAIYQQTAKEKSSTHMNEDDFNYDGLTVESLRLPSGHTHNPIVPQELSYNILTLKGKKCHAGIEETSGFTASSIADKIRSSTSCDSVSEEASSQKGYGTCAIISKDEFEAVLNKALGSSGRYCLDEIFKYDSEDKDLLWQSLDV